MIDVARIVGGVVLAWISVFYGRRNSRRGPLHRWGANFGLWLGIAIALVGAFEVARELPNIFWVARIRGP